MLDIGDDYDIFICFMGGCFLPYFAQIPAIKHEWALIQAAFWILALSFKTIKRTKR